MFFEKEVLVLVIVSVDCVPALLQERIKLCQEVMTVFAYLCKKDSVDFKKLQHNTICKSYYINGKIV